CGQKKSRFECDHVVGLERIDALRNKVGRLGMPQAQPMPGVRGEVAVEPVGSEMARTTASTCAAGTSGHRSASPAASASMQISYSSTCRGVGSSPTTNVFVKSAR